MLLLYSFQYIKIGLYLFMLISLGLPTNVTNVILQPCTKNMDFYCTSRINIRNIKPLFSGHKEVKSYPTLSYPSLREFGGKLDLAQILSVDD